jgi:hypothetical protein
MSVALLTALGVGLVGLVTTAIEGGTDLARHISLGIVSTMVTLLAHSMVLFYLIGKGRAVKDAMAEHRVTGNYVHRIAAARRRAFPLGTLAMAATMVAALMGATADTAAVPPIIHAMIAYGAIVTNLAAARTAMAALAESTRVTDEVNRLIAS